jgi:hypothetical protein
MDSKGIHDRILKGTKVSRRRKKGLNPSSPMKQQVNLTTSSGEGENKEYTEQLPSSNSGKCLN